MNYIKKQESYNLLIKMARNITSSLNDEKLLDFIIEEVIKVIPSADTGLLYLFDKKSSKLILRSIIGFYNNYYTTLEPGEGVSGRVFKTGDCVILNGIEKTKEAIFSMSMKNIKNYNDIVSNDYPCSVISVPLKVHNNIIGVLTVDNFYSSGEFTSEDLELLQAAADHISVVINQAQLMKKEKEYRRQLEKVHLDLKNKHMLLEQTLKIHKKLTNIVLKDKGFEEIIKLLSDMIGYPTVVYNLFLKVVAANTKDKELPSNFIQSLQFKNMVKNKIYQIINNVEEKENLYIFPIVGANKMLGFIAVWVSNNRKLEEIEHVALDYSSTVFALEWLKQEAVFETSQKIKGEFFKSIISGYLDEDVIIQANQLGFNSKDYFGVALFKSFNKDSKRLTVMENKRSNIFHYLNEYFNKEKIKGIVIPEKNYFCVLVSFTENKQTCIKKINNLSEKIINLYPELHVGIGRLYSGLNNSRNSYLEAKQCFTVMENYDFKKKIIYYGDLGILRFIYKHNEKEIIAYIKDTLFPVLEYDKQKGTDLMITLLEYVKFNKSLQSVAGKMNIHYNTGYSRIKKVEGLLDVKLNNAQDWFNIQAACKIYELLTPNYNEIEES